LTRPHQDPPVTEDIDIQSLGRALWRAKGWILGLAIGAGVVTFIALSMLRPLYTSEARVLIQNDESTFTRPAEEEGRGPLQPVLDEQAVQSQVQVITSRDLAVELIKALDLTNNEAFAKDGGTGPIGRLLRRIGLGGSARSEEEKAANTFAEHLSVYPLAKSSVIAIDYTSGDSGLAAQIANKLAEVYIAWQRNAALEQTKDATAWLNAQIEVLRPKVAEAEAAVEQFKAGKGLFAGTNNVTLNAQQLSELNSQVILAKAQQSEAEARARLINKMLADGGDINATPEVLKSELIGRLIDQRVQVQRQLAELSATLLPSHPRIQQLNSELADVRAQIRDEAAKIVKNLENEAEVASAREASLSGSLNEVKTQTSGLSEAEIKLRALEREAKAERDLLESYLARYREASTRHDMGAVPAQAAIVSQAHASILPSFPKRGPISLLVAVATALLSLAYVLARELIGAPAVPRQAIPATEPRIRDRRVPAAPAIVPPAATTARSNAATPQIPEVGTAAITSAPEIWKPSSTDQVERSPGRSSRIFSPASVEGDSEPQRPSFLPSRRRSDTPPFLATAQADASPTAPPVPTHASDVAPSEQSAAGLINRLRRSLSPSQGASETLPPTPKPAWLERLRASNPAPEESGTEEVGTAVKSTPGDTMSTLSTNDLRAYLNQRLASRGTEAANDPIRKSDANPRKGEDKAQPVLKSLDAVINHVLASGNGGAPRALLVVGASPKVDATSEAIRIARALVAKGEQIVLVDLTRGPAAISGPLGIPRSPGLSDLAAGRAGFEDIVRVDVETPLQVIAAGNPKLAASGDENGRFSRIFDALTQAYDCVVLHADREAVRALTPALKFELPLIIAVLPTGAGANNDKAGLADFAALGCPVMVYEQTAKQPRSRLFGRVAVG
jgi:uncharacterized protein involved in exopolysaccharide biosynthesis/Mrp family chromosome partitioning ATPase